VVGRVEALLWAAGVCAGAAKGGASAERKDRLAGRAGMRGMIYALCLGIALRDTDPVCAILRGVVRKRCAARLQIGDLLGPLSGWEGRDVAAGRYARRAGGVGDDSIQIKGGTWPLSGEVWDR
jgi:hypothetical protein